MGRGGYRKWIDMWGTLSETSGREVNRLISERSHGHSIDSPVDPFSGATHGYGFLHSRRPAGPSVFHIVFSRAHSLWPLSPHAGREPATCTFERKTIARRKKKASHVRNPIGGGMVEGK